MSCFIQLYYVHFGAYVFGVLLTSLMQFVEIFGIFCLVTLNFIFIGLTLITFLYKALKLLYICIEFYFGD